MLVPGMTTPPADTSKAVTDNYIKAVNLNRRIITAAQLAQQSLYDMCMGFKEMRDSKLYKELGYSDFGDYCEQETGIKKVQAYSYIKVAEKLPTEFVRSSEQIGIKKLYLLSSLSEQERTEITETTDLESTSVRELEQQIKLMKAEKDKAVAEKSAAEAEASASAQQAKALEKAKEQLSQQIISLEAEIRELESRPVEVAVQEPSDGSVDKDTFKNICKTYEDQLDKVQEDALQNTIRINKEHTAQIEQLKADNESRLEELRKELEEAKQKQSEISTVTVIDSKAVFKAYLANAIDAAKRLCDYMETIRNDDNYGLYAEKARQFVSEISNRIKEENSNG